MLAIQERRSASSQIRTIEEIYKSSVHESVFKIKFISPDDPKNPKYIVAFRGGDPEKRKQFPQKKFIMPISIGQPVHENGKMTGTLALVNRSFHSGYILIDDVIQRHTLKIFHPNKSEQERYNMCLKNGDEWIRRYQSFCQKIFGIEYKIIRWEHWLNHEDFQSALAKVKDVRLKNPFYNEAFDQSINEYISRAVQKDPSVDYKWAYQCCLEYLEEECAAMFLWPTLGIDLEVYPANRNPVMQATSDLLILPHYGKPVDHTGLRFQKRKPKQS